MKSTNKSDFLFLGDRSVDDVALQQGGMRSVCLTVKNTFVPVDVLFVDVGSVNDLMRDALVRHLVRAADADGLVPGHFSTETPGR